MRKFIAVTVLLLLAGFCFGQNTLVVVPLQNRGDAGLNQDVATITELLGNFVARTQRFDVVDRAALEDLMEEHKFQMDDWSSDSKSVEMGRVLNANFIVRGQISRLGSNLIVTARILDVNTARILGTSEMQLGNVGEAYGKMESFVQTLTSNIATSSRRSQGTSQETREQARKTAAEDEWKNKWIYLGGGLGFGSWSWSPDYNDSVKTGTLYSVAFQADFALTNFFSLEADLGLGISDAATVPVIPLLAKLGGRFAQVELSANIGYTVGIGFTFGATVGFHAGPGIIFAQFFDIPSASPPEGVSVDSIILVFVGYKVGLADK